MTAKSAVRHKGLILNGIKAGKCDNFENCTTGSVRVCMQRARFLGKLETKSQFVLPLPLPTILYKNLYFSSNIILLFNTSLEEFIAEFDYCRVLRYPTKTGIN